MSFLRLGVCGFLTLSPSGDSFSQQVTQVAENLYQQHNIDELAKANRLLTFETSQNVSADGRHANITLFDYELTIANDAGDEKSVLRDVSKPNVSFDQIIGAEDAKRELYYFVEYLRNPKKYLGTGVSAPKGVLLYGPPGTGKTMLAKAMASASNITFIASEGNQFLKKYVGEGPEQVHALFRTARKYAPAILFVDEIDAIAKERDGGENSVVSSDVLTAFLAEMDGFRITSLSQCSC